MMHRKQPGCRSSGSFLQTVEWCLVFFCRSDNPADRCGQTPDSGIFASALGQMLTNNTTVPKWQALCVADQAVTRQLVGSAELNEVVRPVLEQSPNCPE